MADLEKYSYKEIPVIANGKEIPSTYGLGIRHTQAFLLFLALTVGYMVDTHTAVSILAMTDKPNINHFDVNMTQEAVKDTNILLPNSTNKNTTYDDIIDEENCTTIFRTYNWTKWEQDMILMSFILGTAFMILPMGIVNQRFGGKLPLQIGFLITGVTSIPVPWITLWGGWKAVCVCRVLYGIVLGSTIYPSTLTLMGQWVPENERARMTNYINAGATVGAVLGYQLGGIISETLGWPWMYWLVGILCLMNFILITLLGAAMPSDHKHITTEEKNFILGRVVKDESKNRYIPWKAMLTSKAAWATFATQVGTVTAFVFCMVQVPTYVNHVLGYNIKNSGLLTSISYIFNFFTSISVGYASDYCTNTKHISIKNARRICNTFGDVGVVICLVAATFITDALWSMVLLIVSIAANGATYSGWLVNYIDLAPNYSGTLASVGGLLSDIMLLTLPILMSYVITDTTSQSQWRTVFLTIAALTFVTNIIFVIFLSADKQPWNEDKGTHGKDKEETKRLRRI